MTAARIFQSFGGVDDSTVSTMASPALAAVRKSLNPEWDTPDLNTLIYGPFSKNSVIRGEAFLAKGATPAQISAVMGFANIDTPTVLASLNAGVPIQTIVNAIGAGQFVGGSDPYNVTAPWIRADKTVDLTKVPAGGGGITPPLPQINLEPLWGILSPLNNPPLAAGTVSDLSTIPPIYLAAAGLGALILLTRK